MSHNIILLLIIFSVFLLACDKNSPNIPESYKLLPKSDVAISYDAWHYCSMPQAPEKNIQYRSQFGWWNPYEKIAIQEIWSTIEVSPDVAGRIVALSFEFQPDTGITESQQCWNGIMLYLPDEFQNQFDSFQYFEITLKKVNNYGIIHFDIGEISEDVIPNFKLDSEDKPIHGFWNGILDPWEDTGIDGMIGRDPEDWWDINENGVKDQNEPISFDDYEYSIDNYYDYRKINGTENNARLDTEDLNFNTTLDKVNKYYEYSINMDDTSPDTILINPSLPTNEQYRWYTYKIDLNKPTAIIGNPNPLKPKFFRIWIDGVSSKLNLMIAVIDFK